MEEEFFEFLEETEAEEDGLCECLELFLEELTALYAAARLEDLETLSKDKCLELELENMDPKTDPAILFFARLMERIDFFFFFSMCISFLIG